MSSVYLEICTCTVTRAKICFVVKDLQVLTNQPSYEGQDQIKARRAYPYEKVRVALPFARAEKAYSFFPDPPVDPGGSTGAINWA